MGIGMGMGMEMEKANLASDNAETREWRTPRSEVAGRYATGEACERQYMMRPLMNTRGICKGDN